MSFRISPRSVALGLDFALDGCTYKSKGEGPSVAPAAATATECPYLLLKRALASLTVNDRVSDGRDDDGDLKNGTVQQYS